MESKFTLVSNPSWLITLCVFSCISMKHGIFGLAHSTTTIERMLFLYISLSNRCCEPSVSILFTLYNKTYLPVFHSLTFCGDHNFYDVRELVLESITFFLKWSSDIMNVENVNIVYDEDPHIFSQLIISTIRSIFHEFDKMIDVSNTLMNKLGSNLPSQWELTLRIWLQLIWEKNCLLLRFCLFR